MEEQKLSAYLTGDELKRAIIQRIQELMRLGDVSLEEIFPGKAASPRQYGHLRSLAGMWKEKDIDALAYQNILRDELEKFSV